ncbi:MAG: 4Fe-4S dicluster domain-containing protein [Coriobacteriales bacterium]|jgi:ferredoxin-type protein NapG|nr:4Fe-4S dicluster domain-containing protein [Coriobacteriales bacterium]
MGEPQPSEAPQRGAVPPTTRAGRDAAQPSDASRRAAPRGISRRGLLAGAAGAALLLGLGGVARATAGDTVPLRPPGGQGEQRFIAACIHCDRCRGVCPRGVIGTCGIEDGIVNMRTPTLDFHVATAKAYRRGAAHADQEAVLAKPYEALLDAGGSGFCDFCMLCAKNCPTGALAAFDPDRHWIGEARIVPRSCIAFDKLGGCRKCVDYCPFGAISLDEGKRPVVQPEKCNGCGVCENICPSSTYRTFRSGLQRGIEVVVNEQGRPL